MKITADLLEDGLWTLLSISDSSSPSLLPTNLSSGSFVSTFPSLRGSTTAWLFSVTRPTPLFLCVLSSLQLVSSSNPSAHLPVLVSALG